MTVPAGIVDGLRRAVFAAIGEAAEAINESAFAKNRAEHREWFTGPTNDLVEMYELLEAIGWAATVPPVSVQVDLRAHGRALMRALRGALDFAEADAEEASRVPAEQSGTARSAERGTMIEHVEALRDFIGVAQPRFDAIEHERAR
ncbi:MAG TPA: hypothetical protein VG053_03530 [Solirubrobacteraceae bacterium]|nr:hypothetical protein [Solirubrobacteraceae bacterium]